MASSTMKNHHIKINVLFLCAYVTFSLIYWSSTLPQRSIFSVPQLQGFGGKRPPRPIPLSQFTIGREKKNSENCTRRFRVRMARIIRPFQLDPTSDLFEMSQSETRIADGDLCSFPWTVAWALSLTTHWSVN